MRDLAASGQLLHLEKAWAFVTMAKEHTTLAFVLFFIP